MKTKSPGIQIIFKLQKKIINILGKVKEQQALKTRYRNQTTQSKNIPIPKKQRREYDRTLG